MKKIFSHIALLLEVSLFLWSCGNSEYSYDKIVPSDYHKILLFKNSGNQTLNLSTVQTNYQDSIVVLKAGSDPGLSANVMFNVLSQNALDSVYNIPLGVDYRVIPAEDYSFNNGREMSFGSGEIGKYLCLSMDAYKIYNYIHSDSTATAKTKYVLPIQMVSTKNDTVSSDRGYVMEFINVRKPVIKLPSNTYTAMNYETLDYNLTATVENYNMNASFDCDFDESKSDSLLRVFQSGHPNYACQLMPKEAYGSLPKLQFSNGNVTGSALLTFKRAPLQNDTHYVLPLMLKSTSLPNSDLNAHIQYLVITPPTYGTEWITDVSTWKVAFDNSDYKFWSDGTSGDAGGATKIIDNDYASYWHSSFGGMASSYTGTNGAGHKTGGTVTGDDYCYNFKDFHAFAGKRPVGSICLALDMQKHYYVVGVRTWNRPQNYDTQTINFYVSDDDSFNFLPLKSGGKLTDYDNPSLNTWQFLLTHVRSATTGAQDSYLKMSSATNVPKGRFLKLRFMDSRRAGVVNMAELRVCILVSVNGKSVY